MRDAPACLIVERCEETVVDERPNLDNWTTDTFPESRFVTNFFEKGGVGDEDKLVAEDIDFKNGPYGNQRLLKEFAVYFQPTYCT